MTTLGEEARPLIGDLATARFLVTSSEQGIETVEVAHEALIRHWNRSQGLGQQCPGLPDLAEAVGAVRGRVAELNRDRTALLRGGLLAEAQRWLAERPQDLDAPEREFIEASIRQQEKGEASGSLEEAVPRRTFHRRCRGCVRGNGPGRVAWWQWGTRDENAAIAKEETRMKALRNLSASLAAQSAAVRDKLPQRSVLLASNQLIFMK